MQLYRLHICNSPIRIGLNSYCIGIIQFIYWIIYFL